MEKDDDFTDWLIAREECIMDLDDEELKATRKLNGVAKESNIEEDIKRCEKLIEPQNANWIGITNQLAIAHLIEKVKELRAMCEEYCPKTERIKELEEERQLVGMPVRNKRDGKIGIVLHQWENGSIAVLENISPRVINTHDSFDTLEIITDEVKHVKTKDDSIPVQKVKDKIEEINEDEESKYYDTFLDARDIYHAIKILEELLEDK